MSNRNRIHESSIHRRRGPTHTHDYPVEGRKKRRAEAPDIEENRYAPHIGRKRLSDGDYYRESYWDAEEFREGRPPHNNYDDYDRIYPPSQGR